jgi:hypothetical protein
MRVCLLRLYDFVGNGSDNGGLDVTTELNLKARPVDHGEPVLPVSLAEATREPYLP